MFGAQDSSQLAGTGTKWGQIALQNVQPVKEFNLQALRLILVDGRAKRSEAAVHQSDTLVRSKQ
jgi:hypothetical protein